MQQTWVSGDQILGERVYVPQYWWFYIYAGTRVISVTDSTECVNERGKQKQENLNTSADGIAISHYHLHKLEKIFEQWPAIQNN